ncbi:uncharacterized protein PITG_01198 [Phytophthora infestans T30-4]|uniref:Uncharacterized protein n=1 Tax=Phytophthora infestans (strain T30-4) TaxID=403677 RepID=D0MUW1_PHYIT|nr:uncharacterized protein PITG_01198 [Phytophthora infestans T30-4]EEY60957.1 hypothetical protein PITG_01198 [Phytophthora infestans T30-4]|eukprot:XP_002907874.1 hypothetical protein PITG_01198 [Phytophthora infestans T30-4]
MFPCLQGSLYAHQACVWPEKTRSGRTLASNSVDSSRERAWWCVSYLKPGSSTRKSGRCVSNTTLPVVRARRSSKLTLSRKLHKQNEKKRKSAIVFSLTNVWPPISLIRFASPNVTS